MYTVLLVIHTIVILFLIGVILLQRPESDGLGGLGGGGGNLLSGRAAGNVLTRITAILATLFILSSLVLAIMAGRMSGTSLVDRIEAPVEETVEGGKAAAPAKEEAPSVPKPE